MLTLYVVCLVVGGLLVALSIFGGGDADVDTDFTAEADFDVETTVDGGEAAAVGGPTRFLSVRNVVFLVAFFGLTGTLLTLLGAGALLTAPFSVALGLAAAGTIHYVMRQLGGSEAGEVPDAGALEGALADVVVDLDEIHSGKIAVRGGDRTLQMIARVHEDAEVRRFQAGDEVVIVGVRDGIAQVAGTRFLA